MNIHRADVVPELRAHIDKIIELVELRHYPMVRKPLDGYAPIPSNALDIDTLHYLLELMKERGFTSIYLENLLYQIALGSEERRRYVEEAAKRNDFRSVLRTNAPCSHTALNHYRR